MKTIEIGIFGAPINNMNLGCQALTYSIVSLLEQVSKNLNIEFHYNLFDRHPDENRNIKFCEHLGVDCSKITVWGRGNFHDVLRRIKYRDDNKKIKSIMPNCSFVIDLTEGDSFTDIYGQYRLDVLNFYKVFIERVSSLILGSQTYGPFNNITNEKVAADIIKKATAVFTRDKISGSYVKKISDVDPILTCDLAFRLPYKSHADVMNRQLKKIGFNVSGLLVSGKKEDTDTVFTLETNYDAFVKKILEYLVSKSYEIHLIGHVEADYTVNKILKEKYPSVILAPEFDNPMDAKSYISSMDLFIGSRMHATIAALTSNTPVVPVAYSRKFTGLFENVDYPYVVDLQTEDTNETVQAVIDRIENYDETKRATEKSYQIAMRQNDECLKAYETVIRKVLSNR